MKHFQFHAIPIPSLHPSTTVNSSNTTSSTTNHVQTSSNDPHNNTASSNHSKPPVEFGDGMALAIAPLTLLGEWKAHDCPILACM
jgi:hypothetical protein